MTVFKVSIKTLKNRWKSVFFYKFLKILKKCTEKYPYFGAKSAFLPSCFIGGFTKKHVFYEKYRKSSVKKLKFREIL